MASFRIKSSTLIEHPYDSAMSILLVACCQCKHAVSPISACLHRCTSKLHSQTSCCAEQQCLPCNCALQKYSHCGMVIGDCRRMISLGSATSCRSDKKYRQIPSCDDIRSRNPWVPWKACASYDSLRILQPFCVLESLEDREGLQCVPFRRLEPCYSLSSWQGLPRFHGTSNRTPGDNASRV